MDSYESRLRSEINELREDLLSRGEEVRPSWIAHKICGKHAAGLADNDDADLWRWSGYKVVRDYCRREITLERKPEGEQPELPGIPGYKHLRRSYTVDRDGDPVEVPIALMTDEELDAKDAFYRSMGVTCFEHADEFRRYKRARADIPTAEPASAPAAAAERRTGT